MTAEEGKTLHLFETRVRQLMLKHQEVLRENEELRTQLMAQRDEKAQLVQEMAVLREQYAQLKMAKMLEITSADTEDAQKRIAHLIREIDKCIALLNV